MAHKTNQYCVAENWGKGFITNDDSINFSPSSFPGNVWRVNAHNQNANGWVSRVNGTHKTLSEAQGIVDAEITSAQSAWDSDNVEGESAEDKNRRLGSRPEDITLTE
jgi:hypothetical protein|tara:strand:- start:184 stop:504 length:321 start_codon:yes stop_codon:yes gene_type:complete